MIPFLLWALIRILIYPPYHIDAFVNAFLYPDGSFWFLWVLFFISIIFVVGDWLSDLLNVKLEWIIGTICLVLAALMVFVDIRVFGFQFIAYYFLFYSFGFYLHKYKNLVTDKKVPLLVLTILWFILAWNWNMHKLPVVLSYIPLSQSLMQYSYRFLTAVIAIYILFGVSSIILDKNERWNVPMIELGKISLGIYTSHMLLMPFIVTIMTNYTHNIIVIITIAFVVALTISWAVVWLLNKWKVSARLLLGKI